MFVRRPTLRLALASAMTLALSLTVAAHSPLIHPLHNAGPVFGIAPELASLLVADAGAGIVRVKHSGNQLVAPLPGITDVASVTPWVQLAVTGGGPNPGNAKLYRVTNGKVAQIADLGAFEATVNPDGKEINPNPFSVKPLLNGAALVADAGGNSLLHIDKNGTIDWVATLPEQLVSTANVKQLFNCPAGPPNICGLPPMIPAQPVATSVAVGLDGAYYVGELKGFPAPTGASRVWRIKPGVRHVQCGSSPHCRVVADGFTSIVDLAFDLTGRLLVTELDESSWFAVEETGNGTGGTVNVCSKGGHWFQWSQPGNYDECEVVATGIPTPLGATFDLLGRVHYLNNALEPGAAEVVTLKRP
jgi:hypothetical protein